MKQCFSTALTDSAKTDIEGVGSVRHGTNGERYMWVKNVSTTTALTAGMAACHRFADGADMFKYIDVPATANLSLLAGIVRSTSIAAYSASAATACFGWIQIFGYCGTVSVFQSQTTVKSLGTHLKGVDAQTYLDTDVAAGVAPIYRRTVQLLETIATVTTGAAASKKAFIFN